MSISDDGQGIPADFVAGYGLRNMRDRARLLDGELEINSQPGSGTHLQLTIPYGKELDREEDNYFGG